MLNIEEKKISRQFLKRVIPYIRELDNTHTFLEAQISSNEPIVLGLGLVLVTCFGLYCVITKRQKTLDLELLEITKNLKQNQVVINVPAVETLENIQKQKEFSAHLSLRLQEIREQDMLTAEISNYSVENFRIFLVFLFLLRYFFSLFYFFFNNSFSKIKYKFFNFYSYRSIV